MYWNLPFFNYAKILAHAIKITGILLPATVIAAGRARRAPTLSHCMVLIFLKTIFAPPSPNSILSSLAIPLIHTSKPFKYMLNSGLISILSCAFFEGTFFILVLKITSITSNLGERMEKVFSTAKELKIGKYILIDDTPCRIASMDKSKPGKHGAAKLRIVAIGVFDGSKKNWLGSTDSDVEVPMIDRSNAQIIAVNGDVAQLMDTKTFETFEVAIPEEMRAQAEAGKEVELLVAMGKRAIQRIK